MTINEAKQKAVDWCNDQAGYREDYEAALRELGGGHMTKSDLTAAVRAKLAADDAALDKLVELYVEVVD